MRHQGVPVWVYVMPLVMIVIGYAIAFARKGHVSSTKVGSRRLEVRSLADPATVFRLIAALRAPFTVDDKDPSANILVLSSPVTFFTWGFLYPVVLHADGTGTRIEIGCHSRFIQMGPLVSRAHRKCADTIEQALSIPEARIA